MELTIFARFHARDGKEEVAAATLRDQIAFVRSEPGCVGIEVLRSIRDPRLFFIHSRWTDEASFDIHAELPNTNAFLERMDALTDQPRNVTRARPITWPASAQMLAHDEFQP